MVTREHIVLLFSLLGVLIAFGIDPQADRFTWFLETLPVFIALPLLLATFSHFPLTLLSYRLIWLFSVVLIIGGHYTYAEMPLFNWLQESFDLTRNHYDRVGHFLQGVTPAIVAREILLRQTPLMRGGWLFFLVLCISLSISATYELIEWGVALLSGEAAAAFLGTQGDVWDTQWDMFLALTGATVAQLVFARTHNRQLHDIDPTLLVRK